MLNFKNFKQKSPQQRFLFILGLAMFLFYFFLGLTLIFFGKFWENTPFLNELKYRIAFGVVLIAYGIFRFSRLLSNDQ